MEPVMSSPGGSSALMREAKAMLPVYSQLPFTPVRGEGCDIITTDNRRILDLYGGHAVAALGYGHPQLTQAIAAQSSRLLFQSNAVAIDIRAEAAEKLVSVAPPDLSRVFFANSGAEANENALRIACLTSSRKKVLAIEHGFHGRTAAAGAVTWGAKWFGFPQKPFEVEFIPRDDVDAAVTMIDSSVAAVIFEPVQGIAGAFDLDAAFVHALRERTQQNGTLLIADEVQCGMGRSGHFFACDAYDVKPDMLTSAKAIAGGIPAAAVLVTENLSGKINRGQLGSTFGGNPVAAAAIVAVIDSIINEGILDNVRSREAEIREKCVIGPVRSIRGMGLLLGLVCDRPARDVRDYLLNMNILTGTSADENVLRLLPPLIIESRHVTQLADALNKMT